MLAPSDVALSEIAGMPVQYLALGPAPRPAFAAVTFRAVARGAAIGGGLIALELIALLAILFGARLIEF
jgi:hypothetical protein